MRLYKNKTLRKGILDKEYLLIEFVDVEERRGKILNMDRVATEIGYNKILFEGADIIISKIDPYLGYTFINDKSKTINWFYKIITIQS